MKNRANNAFPRSYRGVVEEVRRRARNVEESRTVGRHTVETWYHEETKRPRKPRAALVERRKSKLSPCRDLAAL